MKRSWPPLVISILLFVAWLIYLGIQAWEYRRPPVIVSRAQLLAAQYDVTANLAADPGGKVETAIAVAEVLFAADNAGPKPEGKVEVINLKDCIGFVGPGTYVLPLAKRGGAYQVAVPPLDPGVSVYKSFPPRIYPLNDQVRKQFEDIRGGRNQ
jgi:hypothetical protein